ncbi:ARL14 effector protein [Colletes gigas]|uniref:ARL14 effector protein n=1 Tax=Colletes gigas TaxID=935657 RepID=UPI001C9AE8A6|nr:ARL14 effector protein [Colletes gigas]XP_043261108.1 ARL14 effector protein [Colletes gigas]XP_043261109.1 ARL14 effector protein [Colletes gigas]
MDTGNSTSGGDSSSQLNLEKTPRAERRVTRGSRQRAVDSVTKKFLRNFDPEHSEREKRKLHRRLYQGHKRHALYDENGIFIETGEEPCDCLYLNCSGCHFPCPKCASTKCAHECRSNRKWTYESIENEGCDIVIKNRLLKDS